MSDDGVPLLFAQHPIGPPIRWWHRLWRWLKWHPWNPWSPVVTVEVEISTPSPSHCPVGPGRQHLWSPTENDAYTEQARLRGFPVVTVWHCLHCMEKRER